MKNFPKEITSEKVLKELRSNRDKYILLQGQEEIIFDLGEVISDLAERSDDFSAIFGWDELFLVFTLRVKGFTAEAEPRLMEFISLAENAFKSEVYMTSDDHAEGTRSYFIRVKHKFGGMVVQITAVLNDEGLCKRVKVGTRKVPKLVFENKIVDEDVYEIVC